MAQEPLAPGLLREGAAMLAAVLDGLAALPGVEILALRDARLAIPGEWLGPVEWICLDPGIDAAQRYRELLQHCDAAWPIAPETGGILERLCHMAEAAGKPLLTSPAAAVRIAASKLRAAQRLAAGGVPVAQTVALDSGLPLPAFPRVIKPDDGVGCEGARIVATSEDWRALPPGLATAGYVAQPLLEGEALSLSALFAQGQARLLSVNRQRIVRRDGAFALRGCEVNAAVGAWVDWEGLAQHVAAAMPELWGYAGIDLILTAQGPRVLEINPRLTTSYAGLKASTGLNYAELILDLWREGRLPELPRMRRAPVEVVLEPT